MLDNDINLRKLWQNGKLNNALRYVDKLMDNYIAIKRKYGECEIRIGTLGTGHAPNYSFRVIDVNGSRTNSLGSMMEYDTETGKLIGEFDEATMKALSAVAQSRHFFSGTSHKQVEERNVIKENWSEPPMTFNELAMLRYDIERSEGKAKQPKKR